MTLIYRYLAIPACSSWSQLIGVMAQALGRPIMALVILETNREDRITAQNHVPYARPVTVFVCHTVKMLSHQIGNAQCNEPVLENG